MTTPPKELLLDEAAEEYCKDQCYCTDTAKHYFKAGAAYQAGVDGRRAQVMVEALESMIREAKDQLQLYVRAYKREPYDTGIMLQLYINETIERINRCEQVALAAYKSKGTK